MEFVGRAAAALALEFVDGIVVADSRLGYKKIFML